MPSCKSNYRNKPKYKHLTKESAMMHVLAIRKSGQLHEVEAYKCRDCGFWHVGRIPMFKIVRRELGKRQAREEAMVGQLIAVLIKILRKEA